VGTAIPRAAAATRPQDTTLGKTDNAPGEKTASLGNRAKDQKN
jgi:hypothetical protein